MVYDAVNDQLVVFGGSISRTGTEFLPLADTYIRPGVRSLARLDSEGLLTALSRLLFLEGRNQVLLYGGGGANAFTGPFINDVWLLDLETSVWSRVWGPRDQPRTLCSKNPTLVYDAEAEQVLMFAGHDDTAVGHRNDVWHFDLNTNAWTEVKAGDTGAGEGCARFCSCEPICRCRYGKSERRQYHSFAYPWYSFGLSLRWEGRFGYLDDARRFDLNGLSWKGLILQDKVSLHATGQEGCRPLLLGFSSKCALANRIDSPLWSPSDDVSKGRVNSMCPLAKARKIRPSEHEHEQIQQRQTRL